MIIYFPAEVVAEDEIKRLSEGTIVALGCLGGTLFVALVLLLTCFLIRYVHVNIDFYMSGNFKKLNIKL